MISLPVASSSGPPTVIVYSLRRAGIQLNFVSRPAMCCSKRRRKSSRPFERIFSRPVFLSIVFCPTWLERLVMWMLKKPFVLSGSRMRTWIVPQPRSTGKPTNTASSR